jgi:hypothetical protein
VRIAKEQVDVRLEIPGAVIRQQQGFGDVRGFETMSGEYFSLAAGVDTTPLFVGLAGDLCQCPHWGYIIKGRLRVWTADGASEFHQGQAFYWPPGHAPEALDDSEFLEISPTRQLRALYEHLARFGEQS